MTPFEFEGLRAWIGRTESATEVLSPVPAQCLAATLSLPAASLPQDTLPPLWHWIYFPDTTPSDALGDDGAPRGQTLMPPIPLEQVMWAGAEFEFIRPLRTGVATRKQSTLSDMAYKEGSRGEMVFVTWERRYEQDGETALIERSRAVFLGAARPDAGGKGNGKANDAPEAARRKAWLMNEAVLFRYSALTFNAHRIHYDHRYAMQIGGYPGLVVHGPLQATLLAETYRAWHPDRAVTHMAFRARAPLYLGPTVEVCAQAAQGDTLTLWTRAADGGPAMECVVTAANQPR